MTAKGSGTREDPSLRRETGPLYAFTMQGLYAVGVAGVALGTAQAMLDAFVDLAQRLQVGGVFIQLCHKLRIQPLLRRR